MRSAKWLAAVRQIECCVICGRYGVQAAHRNQGKGIGFKVCDAWTAALCPNCHHEIDNGPDLSREERREMIDTAILKTIEQLFTRGLIDAV